MPAPSEHVAPEQAASDPTAPKPETKAVCQNCAAPLLGPHCYRCGQPVNGLVRHFSSVVGDALDSLLNIDARVVRSLWPLFAKPGYLSCEYFAGRRVRYVSPVRLFVFLSIVTFFIARLTLNLPGDPIQFDNDNDTIATATTIAQVDTLRDAGIARLEKARAQAKGSASRDKGLLQAEAAVRAQAQARIDALKAAAARNEPPPESTQSITFMGDKPWDQKTNPVTFDVLPAFANSWINEQIGRAQGNITRMKRDPSLFKDAVLSAIPSTLFVLLPVFALLLKLLYIFKRRLYMEHLIVALHSHAFLCLTLLLVFLLTGLRQALPANAGGLQAVTNTIEILLFVWMPVYLLLMQKRVYGQGWPMTLVKYCVLGLSYSVLLSFGAAFTIVASLVSA